MRERSVAVSGLLAAHLVARAALTADFDHRHIRSFLGELHRKGNSRASAARKLAAIRTFGRYLRREGALDGDPAALVGTPKREQRLPAHLGEAEMARLLEIPDVSQPLGRRDRAILELFYASGLRLSELVGLDLEDVNLNGRMVRVLGKGRKERLVPFNRSAESALRAWLNDLHDRGNDLYDRGPDLAAAANASHALELSGSGHRRAASTGCRGTSRRHASASARRPATRSPPTC